MHVTLLKLTFMKTRLTSLSKFFARTPGLCTGRRQFALRCLTGPGVNSRFYIYEAYKDEDAVAFQKPRPTTKPVSRNWNL